MLGSSAIFLNRGSFVRNELNSSWTGVNTQNKNKIKKIQILLPVVLSTFLLQEKIFVCHLKCAGLYVHVMEQPRS